MSTKAEEHTLYDCLHEFVSILRTLFVNTLRIIFLLMIGMCTCAYLTCYRRPPDYCRESAPRNCREVGTFLEPGTTHGGRCYCITHDSNWREWNTPPIQ